MISIIICTANEKNIIAVEKNISETIGVEYEMIVIDNSHSQFSIFEAYNIGVQKSKYPILCFMHDDIVYHSKNWGKSVIAHFTSSEIGMIGIGGTKYLSSIPSIWWAGAEKFAKTQYGTLCINCIQTERVTQKSTIMNYHQGNSSMSEVVVLDGLWFCIPNYLFDLIQFDEKTFSGFHFYDLDISMQIRNHGFKIFCIYDLTIEHIADSRHNKSWLKNCYSFYFKWKKHLPVQIGPLPVIHIIYIKYKAIKFLIYVHVSNKVFFNPWIFLKAIF